MRAKIFSSNNTPSLNILQMGFSSDTYMRWSAPAVRNCYIIHYVTRGKGYYNGHLVTEGQGFLVHPGQLEEHYADPDDPWDYLWIMSRNAGMKSIFKRYNADRKTLIFNYDFVPVVKKIADEIIAKKNSIVDDLYILEIFLHILNHHTKSNPKPAFKSNHEMYLEFAVNYIESNISEPITINELAGLIGISQTYLYTIFNNRFNISPKQYILSAKLSRAKKMLVDTNMSITEIASSVGYDDSLAFSKVFSSKEKMSPQKYRNTMRNKS